jgi:hypothetical protein
MKIRLEKGGISLLVRKVGLCGFVSQAISFCSLFFQAWGLPGREILFRIGPEEALLELFITLLFIPFQIYFFAYELMNWDDHKEKTSRDQHPEDWQSGG